MEEHSAEAPREPRGDFGTRWKKGQSGNPTGRKLTGAGATLTGLARTMMERPVRSSESGELVTRLAEYMTDVVRRADAGDLKCRMFLLKAVERGDRRRETAQRNAKKAKSEELRNFEEAKADEISVPMPPLPPETEDAHAAMVRPTAPPNLTTAPPGNAAPQKDAPPAFAAAGAADKPQKPAAPPLGRVASAATLQRDPQTGRLLTPDGRPLSREEEERLLYPHWPHISPHLKKGAAANAGKPAGPKSPAPQGQAVDSKQDFESENFSHENASPGAGRKDTRH